MEPIIPRELKFTAEEFKRFCDDNPDFLSCLRDPTDLIATLIISSAGQESPVYDERSRPKGLEYSKENKERAYRTIIEYLFILTHTGLRGQVSRDFREKAMKLIIESPETVLNHNIGYGFLLSTLIGGSGGAPRSALRPENRIMSDIDDIMMAIKENPESVKKLPPLYRHVCDYFIKPDSDKKTRI